MALLQLTQRGILDSLLGNAIGCVRTVITAPAAATTTINTGSTATGGVSGNMDTTPANGSVLLFATPGSGATQNQYTNIDIITITSATATALTIPSQTIGKSRAVGDFIWFLVNGAAAPVTGVPFTLWNTVYIGLTTQLTSGATSANILSGEPTSTGSYARVALLNNPGNFTAATSANPASKTNGAPATFAASTAAYSTGATTLKAVFLSDAPTLAGGNVLSIGDLTTPQAVNASGITPSFASTTLTETLQ